MKVKRKRTAREKAQTHASDVIKEQEAIKAYKEKHVETKYVISVDPGFTTFGFAVFKYNDFQFSQVPTIVDSYSYTQKKGDAVTDSFGSKLITTMNEFRSKIHTYRATALLLFIEEPQYMQSGKGVAALHRGDLVHLSMAAGVFIGYLFTGLCMPVSIKPTQWKGNLPKDVINKRIKKIIGPEESKKLSNGGHDWDAVGIALHQKGLL